MKNLSEFLKLQQLWNQTTWPVWFWPTCQVLTRLVLTPLVLTYLSDSDPSISDPSGSDSGSDTSGSDLLVWFWPVQFWPIWFWSVWFWLWVWHVWFWPTCLVLTCSALTLVLTHLVLTLVLTHIGPCLQAAQVVLISLFELNTPEFTMLLGALPKTFQDGATKLLHSHLKSSSSNVVSRQTWTGCRVWWGLLCHRVSFAVFRALPVTPLAEHHHATPPAGPAPSPRPPTVPTEACLQGNGPVVHFLSN